MKNVEDLYPLSPMQQGLLFHSLYEPGSGYYVEQLSCVVGRGLNVSAFERAWQQLIERHSILRTAFVWEGLDEPLQVVRRSVSVSIAEEDWRAHAPAEQRLMLETFLEADRVRGFDLTDAPLMRFYLFRLDEDAYQFVWSSHHLLMDGWSMFLLLKELFALYGSLSARTPPLQLERSRPFRDYIAWLQQQDMSKAEAYWRQSLKGFTVPTPLGIGRASVQGAAEEHQYSKQQVLLSEKLTDALQAFARQQRLTLGTLMQGAWALLLACYSGEDDVMFGITVSGRPAELAGVETMVGLFINTLPMRVRVDAHASLLDWLGQVQEQQLELRQYEFSPLVEVQGWSDVERGQPLFETILGFENYPVDQAVWELSGGMDIRDVSLAEKTNFPLNLAILPGAQLTLDIMYDCDRFDVAALTRLTGHFCSLLESMVERPGQLLGELPLLTGEERQLMMTEWNETGSDYPAHSCLHELFEAQAARTPDAPALVFEDERLTFAELNARANGLAHQLRALGVGPEVVVGLLSERSLEMVVGLLGVLKAGGAYVPIDPTYPRERLAFIFDDARFSILLTQKHLVEGLPEHEASIVCLDAAGMSAPENEQNPQNLTKPDHLAYIIYTSGSTGRPKGVLISHRAVVNHNHAIVSLYELTAADRVLQFASMSFDVAVEEIFPTWLSGGCVVVRPDSALSSHQAFFDLLRKERISVVNLSTPYWNELMSELSRTGSSITDSLRLAAIGGEKGLPEGFAFAQQQAGAGVRIMNVYGPTETTVTNTVYDMTTCGVPLAVDSVPIGRPIANTDIYILDRNLRPVPIGIGGEIHIGGESIARGYLNRAGQTAEKFIPHPFTSRPGARLYKTGDHARYLPSGDIEFLGRVDHQVKIRGFRIELGEIEAVLSQSPGVREAVVIAREDIPGDKRLVAYLVADGESVLTTTGEWRDYVGARLPEYMVPSAFVLLDEMPLTSNSKLDRRALPAPELSAAATGDASIAPRTPVEEILSGLWCEVLGVERVGVEEDFFDLGGHSLLATQLISRVREAFGVEVALRQMFESPTVAGLAGKIQALINAGRGLEAPLIIASERGERMPLSFAQQRLWFIDQLEPGQAYYNMPAAVRLDGELNEEALERTLNEVVRRHEILRTRYAEVEGQPVQLIEATAKLRLDVRDLSALPVAERQEKIERLTQEEAAQGFDLTSDMLLRVRLLRLSNVEHVLLFTMHHIVSDGWSMGVLVREVAALYEAYAQGAASPLPELAVQYADFAIWQREWLSGETLEAQLAYWREHLAGAPVMLELPTDRPRPSVHTFNGARAEFSLSPELSERLKTLSRQQGVTLFMTLLAGFQLLLSRYSGQEDIVVGADVANRNRRETEDLIGFFVNMMVLRTDLSGDPTFRELLRRVREVTLGAYAHQDLPFEKLVEELQPERNLSHSPLFQVFFVLQNTPMGALELPGLTLNMFETDNATSKFDLLLGMQETEQGIKGEFEFNTDLFDENTIHRMIRHLEELLENIVATPDASLHQLSLLSSSELQLLSSFSSSAPAAPLPSPLAIHRLFEQQAARTPHAIALSAPDHQLSYQQLNERANQLAHYLRSLGVSSDMPVGLCMERSVELVVALLAILKAGGAYVPLDASYPLDRLAWMIEDATVSVLVTESRMEERLPSHWAQVVVVDVQQDDINQHSTRNIEAAEGAEEATGDELAYVMYTSGSTGQPKGVSVTHRGVVRLVRETDYASFGAEEVFLQLAPVSFDASTFEVWGALLNGGRLVVMSAGTPTLEEIGQTLSAEGVTTVWLTAGLFHVMVEEQLAELGRVRQVLAGGDVLGVWQVEKYLREAGAESRLINGYGPTENSTFTCCHVMMRESRIGNSVPIGRPIAHTQVYLLDRNMQPVPVGIAGELHIGGDGLGRGYHNRPDLTAERFVPNPFDAGKRLYRTGDIARYLEDGTIEFLGRRDQQVKIRGFRIELGEIEAVLNQSPGVREAVVIAREDIPGDKRLVAYLVAEDESVLTTSAQWRDYLGERLPAYMTPSAFVMLDEIPLTLNGKIDRKALPAPELSGQAGERSLDVPRTAVEEILSGLWSEVLGVERVGVEEDFFDLGGHSLLATQLISRVREAFGVEVALRQMFESPTVAGLAQHVEAELKHERSVTVPPIVALERGEQMPLSFAQQRLWFLEQLEPDSPFFNMPFAFRMTGELNEEALERTLNEVVRRHEILRTRYVEVEGQPVQIIEATAKLRLDVRDLSALPAAEREVEARWLASEEARKPFDLRVEPVRAYLLRLSEDEHVLLVTMHHIVTDGWSLGVLGKEVAALYEAYAQGELSPLAELAIQYADYALWQREWLQGEVLETQLAYWREHLAGAPAVLELPTDRPRPPMQTFDGEYETFELSAELSARLKALSRQQGVTLFMTLLAGFQLLLSRYSGQEDIVTGTPIANRHQGETEDLIGFFVNTLVMRNNLSGNPTFRELLGRTRETALGAYAHQDLPFEKLVEELQPERSLSYRPLFQVMFALQNAPMGELHLPGLILSRIEDDDAPVKFDLSLDMQEAGERITGAFAYNLDLFDQTTIRRMLTHFVQLLEGIATDAGRRLSELSMLTEAERLTLAQWNETQADYPREAGLHGLFEKQVEQTPEAVAIVSEDERVTYRELNRRANQLAHYLVKRGVKPETTVGLYLERTAEAVVGILAILKAGGTYLPLDTQQPPERLAFILEDARVKALLTQQSLRASLPLHQAEVVCLDADAADIGAQPESALIDTFNPAGVAYLIYTSGTTGQPKAVAVEHRNIVNIINAAARRFDFAEGDVLPVIASFAFDISLFELMTPLASGGCALVCSREHVLDMPALAASLEQCTLLHMVPSLMRQFIETINENGTAQSYQRLRRIFIGGDVVPPELLKMMCETLPSARIEVLYGPTEAALFCTSEAIRPERIEPRYIIGRPLSNVVLEIYDADRNQVPVGVPGELYIGGECVTRGYLNREELTAEKYVVMNGRRYYRSGDRGRFLPDGRIEFMGRIDFQVKVRGFRIELGEIENTLELHAEVTQAAVIAHADNGGEKRLIAYLVAHAPERAPASHELRHFLLERLPEYMVPSVFLWLDAMPLTPNRKVDRRALPLPDMEEAVQKTLTSGLTAVEEILAGIWTELLHTTDVHAGSNFFELGGHSLLAMQLMARVRKNLRVDLPLRQFFAEPTLAALARSVESAFAIDEYETSAIARVSRDEALPLSFAQQRLWFIDQLEPDTAQYNMPLAVHLAGNLNVAALEQTLNEVVRRHESLRTSFPEVGGEARQFIAPTLHLTLDVRDLSALPDAERQAELASLVGAEAALPFNLTTGPLLRARLLRLEETEHVLLFIMHHIISDGWSMGVLLGEVATLYEAFVQEQPSPLAELPIQYADFAHWQRQYLAGDALESQLAYWKTQLGGRLPILELPADRPRPAVQSFRGSHEEFELDEELSEKLKALSRREGVTLFMTLLAAFEVLLSRYSGQSDILVGTPIANRNRTEIEPLIGFFVNTLVIRNQIRGEARFRELMGEVRDGCLSAYAHQDVPFERLVEELQPERSLSHAPLFQVMFVLQNAPAETRNLHGLSFKTLELDTFTSKFDLLLNMQEEGHKITGSMEYSRDLFDASTVRRMLSHLSTLLEGIVADPEQLVHRLPLLSGEESARLLSPPEHASFTYPIPTCIHQQFEAQVERTPQAVALTYQDQHLTYAELNRRANQLAHRLRRSGVGPEMLVGLFMERSVEMIVAVLATLKAGSAYLPLDPAYPQERLAFMLEDAQTRVVLTERHLTENLPAHHGAKVICIDDERESLAGEPEHNPDSGATSENLAYVIYTSGSTGQPKGVMVNHANVARLLAATHSWYGFDGEDVWTLFHSYTFDFSVWELWGALLYGGRLVIVPYLVSRAPDAFYELLSAERVTVLNQTPSAFRQLIEVEQMKKESPPSLSLRLVIFGGEALELQTLKPWFERHGDVLPQLVNMYGITETTVHVTYRPLTAADLSHAKGSVIGSAIPDLQVYVMDQYQQLTPLGVPGELYIGGAGVARAYLNRPELTATRFIPDPFNSAPGARLYRSGDLVRLLPDGDIEYRGRIDEQVKVRGFRIEPEEIRAVLGRHPSIREALVQAMDDDAGDKRLVAYVVPAEPGTLLAGELRSYLQQHLPDYMIPSAFVSLEAFPLTPNGKIDRKALPLPEQFGTALNIHHDAPMTAVEEVLAGIWTEVIEAGQLGVHDNFFDAGGHSLLATQVISRVRLAFQIDLPVRSIYESPTIAEMAAIIEGKLKAGQGLAAPPIVRVGRDHPLPLSFAQQRLWFISQLEPDSASYNSPLAVRLTGTLDVAALARTVNEIVRRHEVLRTHFEVAGGTPVQVIEGEWERELEVLDLSELNAEERAAESGRVAAEEAHAPFNLSTGPVLRTKLLRLDEQEHIFLLTMHHIVSDGWSMGVLIKEVGALYEAYAQGEPSPLAELAVQYGDFAAWQREWLQGEVLEKQLSYWREQLDGILPVLKLPTDRPRPPVPTFRGRRDTFKLPSHLGAALKSLSRLHNTTLFMTMLAAFQILLSRHSGQEDILIGSAIANRNRGETEDLIGFFVNMLVMRGNLSGDPTFQELLTQVRETALGAYAHQDVPFEKLVGEFVQERQRNHAPLVQVAFGLHNAPMRTLELSGLTLQLLDFEEDAGRFDLTLWINDEAGELSGTWYYNTDLFDAETIKRFNGHFETLLAHVVAQPEARISALEMYTEEERRQHQARRKESDESRVRKLRTVMRQAVSETAFKPPPETTLLEEVK